MEINIGAYAATRQTWRVTTTVRELVASLLSTVPKYSDRDLRIEFRSVCRTNDDYFEAVCDYALDNALMAVRNKTKRIEREGVTLGNTDGEKENHRAIVDQIKEQITLLNQELPNGKRARWCTLDYLYRLGGAYRNVGKRGSSKLVGEAYSEQEYRKKLRGVI